MAGGLIAMMRKYFDLHVTSNHSFGSNTIEEMISRAEKLELAGIAIVDMIDTKAELDSIKAEIAAVKTPVQVLCGIEIKAENPSELVEKINKWRDIVDILAVSGGNILINKEACENPKVSFLAHPDYKRKDSGIDHVLAAAAARNFVAIELNFREYLHVYGKLRTHILGHMRTNAFLAQHFKAPLIVASAAQSVWDMRAGRELATLAYLCGLDREQAVRAVSMTPEEIIAKVRRATAPGFVAPGVETRSAPAPAAAETADVEEI